MIESRFSVVPFLRVLGARDVAVFDFGRIVFLDIGQQLLRVGFIHGIEYAVHHALKLFLTRYFAVAVLVQHRLQLLHIRGTQIKLEQPVSRSEACVGVGDRLRGRIFRL